MARLLAALLLLWPVGGLAAPVTVLSGDHPGFTRLVLYFDDIPEWEFGPVAGGYVFRARSVEGYDLSDVFRRIGRDRITALEDTGDGRLRLSIGCDCVAESFTIPEGVVLDVVEAPPRARSPDPAGPDPAAVSLPLLPPVTAADAPAAPPDPDPALSGVRRALAEQLGRAASQGLIDLSLPPGLRAPELPGPMPPAAGEPGGAAGAEAPVRTRSAIDRARPETGPPSLTDDGAACTDPSRIDVGSWGRPPDPRPDIGALRTGLVDSLDRPDPSAVRAAVRHAVYLGFGAEARALLAAFDAEVPDGALLAELAQIVDGAPAPGGMLAPQTGCDGPAALWAVLARPALEATDTVNSAAVTAAFTALPLHLRRHLGPALAGRLLAAEDPETAAVVRNAIARAPGDHGDAVALVEAKLGLAEGRAASLETLDRIASGNGPRAADALVLLIGRRFDAGKPIDRGRAAQAAALARERRGTPLGRSLYAAHVKALIGAGRARAAHEALARLTAAGDLTEAEAARLRPAAITALARDPGLPAALPGLLARPLALGAGPEADAARRALAARVLALGLPAAARDILGERPGGLAPADLRLVARTHLSDGAPERALASLSGLDGAEARELRAAARRARGMPSRAAPEGRDPRGAEAGPAPAASRPGVSPSAGTQAADTPAAEVLSRGRALVTESAARRAEIAELLAAPGEE